MVYLVKNWQFLGDHWSETLIFGRNLHHLSRGTRRKTHQKHNVLKRLDLKKIKDVVVQTLKPDYEGWSS